ncbi:MAG: nitroreductase family protein [Bacteroidales bacterium]|nr:nitroreductase family protein [Bacteroidales bacterium]
MEKQVHFIRINQADCIRCRRCVRICTAKVFDFSSAEGAVRVVQPESCIECGHCVDICPKNAVLHSFFPQEALHSYDIHDFPEPDRLMLLMKARRSNRAFSDKVLPEDYVDKIKEAALCAPTAQNSRNVRVLVVSDPEKIKAVTAFSLETFTRAMRILENPLIKFFLHKKMRQVYAMIPKFKKMNEAFYQQGDDPVLHHAKALMFFLAPANSRFGLADCNLAYQNASLMAESLGVAHFYTGFVISALQQDRKQRLYRLLGIEKMRIYAGMTLAMPEFRFERYADRMPQTR